MAIGDLGSYTPSDGEPAIFMAKALRGSGGENLSAIAFQISTDHIADNVGVQTGMVGAVATFLVGEDLLMRSQSGFFGGHRYAQH